MATYKKNAFLGGKWADKSEMFEKKVNKAKIVSETNPEPSSFKNEDGTSQTQDVCKVQFQGYPEAVKAALNRATINALVDAFGEDSKNWQGHVLTVEIDKLPGKKFPLYLIPEGYKRIEDDNGYALIVTEDAVAESVPPIDDTMPEEIPF